jgi:hypothetical protein
MLSALLAGGLAACTQGQPTVPASTPPPASSTASASAAASASPSESSTQPVLGPTGYGALSLGMTKAEARATGLSTGITTSGTGACGGPGDGYLAGSPTPSSPDAVAGRLVFSASTGRLVAIYAIPDVKTPQGIGLDSSYAQLHAAYSTWQGIGPDSTSGRGSVAVPGNPHAHYRIVVDKKVLQLSLDSDAQDCYE